MNTFLSTLKTEQVGKWTHNLLDVLIFEDEKIGTIIVPIGFTTDFASIKVLHNAFLFIFFALVSGYWNYAAVIHDYIYTTRAINNIAVTRKDADDVLYRALRAEGVARWRAWLFWAGVRLGGCWSYGK